VIDVHGMMWAGYTHLNYEAQKVPEENCKQICIEEAHSKLQIFRKSQMLMGGFSLTDTQGTIYLNWRPALPTGAFDMINYSSHSLHVSRNWCSKVTVAKNTKFLLTGLSMHKHSKTGEIGNCWAMVVWGIRQCAYPVSELSNSSFSAAAARSSSQ
jgi:hypothetical protein